MHSSPAPQLACSPGLTSYQSSCYISLLPRRRPLPPPPHLFLSFTQHLRCNSTTQPIHFLEPVILHPAINCTKHHSRLLYLCCPARCRTYQRSVVISMLIPRSRSLLVTFDAFGTLFSPRMPVPVQYAQVAKEYGVVVNPDDVQDSFIVG